MPLTSQIQPYDPAWPQLYADEVARLTPVLGPPLLELHHVGSTAVPDLIAKPEIDILAIVRSAETAETWAAGLTPFGYQRGGDLSPGHLFFKRDTARVRTHKLHICVQGHASIARMLRFRDHLRAHAMDRAHYAALKLRLERDNTAGIAEYLAGKAPFIDSVLDRQS